MEDSLMIVIKTLIETQEQPFILGLSDTAVTVICASVLQMIVLVLNYMQSRKIEVNTNSITERLGTAKFNEGEASGKQKEIDLQKKIKEKRTKDE